MVVAKKRLFVDMDGTLAEWRSEAGPEELYEKGYFESLRPYSAILGAVKSIWFVAQKEAIGVELFILSAYLPDSLWAKAEKQEWLDTHLPKMFDAERTLFVPCGSSKLDYVPGGVHTGDYLLDDYTPNLREWERAGGTPIKVFNGCNGKRNTSWKDSVRTSADWKKNYQTVPFPVSWTVKMKKKQKETQDILSYHTQAAGCSDKARAKASGGRQPIEECGRTGL